MKCRSESLKPACPQQNITMPFYLKIYVAICHVLYSVAYLESRRPLLTGIYHKNILQHDLIKLLEKATCDRSAVFKGATAIHRQHTTTVKISHHLLLWAGAGESRALFVGPLTSDDKFPKDAQPGRMLAGRLQLAKTSDTAGGKHSSPDIPLVFKWVLTLYTPPPPLLPSFSSCPYCYRVN